MVSERLEGVKLIFLFCFVCVCVCVCVSLSLSLSHTCISRPRSSMPNKYRPHRREAVE